MRFSTKIFFSRTALILFPSKSIPKNPFDFVNFNFFLLCIDRRMMEMKTALVIVLLSAVAYGESFSVGLKFASSGKKWDFYMTGFETSFAYSNPYNSITQSY